MWPNYFTLDNELKNTSFPDKLKKYVMHASIKNSFNCLITNCKYCTVKLSKAIE